MITASQLKDKYISLFGSEPTVLVTSPGRINIIGEHTDYNEGFVLPTAIDKAVYVALGARNDNEIHLYAEDFKESYVVSLDAVAPTDKGWPNYVLGVVNQIQERGISLQGFNLYLDGDVPPGSGLSSSAAVECSAGFALNELFGLGLSRVDIAKIGQAAEHTYVGVKCGIMDQFASVLSKENHVLKLDCRSLEYEYVPLELGDYEILLLNTNIKHSLASSAYNDRRAACERAVALVQAQHPEVQSLRDVNLEMLDTYVRPQDAYIYVKSKYVVEENERLLAAVEALKKGDIAELGRLLFLAHDALSAEYEVSCAELDFLVAYAKQDSDVIGARMMGGGFGGCTINLVKKGASAELVKRLQPLYKEKFNLELTPIYVEAKGGTALL